MKKILFIAIAILPMLFASCNKVKEIKPISSLDSLIVKDGLDRDCKIICTFGEELDGWLTADQADLFVYTPLFKAQNQCKHKGSFIPKSVISMVVDTLKTEKGLDIYRSAMIVYWYASNAYGVQDILDDVFFQYFFEDDIPEGFENPADFYRLNDREYPNENRDLFNIYREYEFKDFVKYGMNTYDDVLDTFEYEGTKYMIVKM